MYWHTHLTAAFQFPYSGGFCKANSCVQFGAYCCSIFFKVLTSYKLLKIFKILTRGKQYWHGSLFQESSNQFFWHFFVCLQITSNIVFACVVLGLFSLCWWESNSRIATKKKSSCLLVQVRSLLALLADAPLIHVMFSLRFRSYAESDAVPLWLWLTSSKLQCPFRTLFPSAQ